MAITLTENAALRIGRNLQQRGTGIGLRLAVSTTGCSGLAYKLDYVDQHNAGDSVFESRGVQIFVDAKSLPYLDGTELDFGRDGLNESFKFQNPNVKDACGCGESFRT